MSYVLYFLSLPVLLIFFPTNFAESNTANDDNLLRSADVLGIKVNKISWHFWTFTEAKKNIESKMNTSEPPPHPVLNRKFHYFFF